MSFLALLIALVLVNVLRVDIAALAQGYLNHYFTSMEKVTRHFILRMLPLFLVVLLLQTVLHHRAAGIFWLILSVFILCFAFKPFKEGSHSLEMMLDEMLTARFCVIFWFILFGPAFALLYVLLLQDDKARPYVWVAEWLPARLLALTFALVGQFSATLKAFAETGLNMGAEPREILYACAKAVLAKDEVNEADLLKRALLAWLVIIAIVTVMPNL